MGLAEVVVDLYAVRLGDGLDGFVFWAACCLPCRVRVMDCSSFSSSSVSVRGR